MGARPSIRFGVDGVVGAAQIFFSDATMVFADGQDVLDISLIGVEPGRPGEPQVLQGQQLGRSSSNEVIIDGNVAARRGVQVGETIAIKVTQGTKEEIYQLVVVGITDGRQYFIRPSLIVPYLTWDKVRPQGENENNQGELISTLSSQS
ncbi:MAG: hypothetical protein R2932_08845 [Caldilineaceae bacterium]